MIFAPVQNLKKICFPAFKLKNHPSLICRKKNSKHLKVCKLGLKECFTIAGTRSNGLPLVSNNKRCNNVIGVWASRVLTFFSDFHPGSRSAYFVYIAYCTAQKKLICHISQNFEEGKRTKREKSLIERKSMTLLFAFLAKFLVHVKPIPFLRWSREMTFPAKLSGPLCYEPCRGVQHIRIDTRLNKVKRTCAFL